MLLSQSVLLNGKLLATVNSNIPALPPRSVPANSGETISLEPLSYGFFVFPTAALVVCGAESSSSPPVGTDSNFFSSLRNILIVSISGGVVLLGLTLAAVYVWTQHRKTVLYTSLLQSPVAEKLVDRQIDVVSVAN
jgi:hypothetical protein